MTCNKFEGKPLRWDQPLYKDQISGPQCGLSLEVSLYLCSEQHVLVVTVTREITSTQ